MMRLTITPLAERDLESIADYVAQDNPSRAVTFIAELREQCRRIAANPQGYRKRPELGDELRSCAYGNYVLFFGTTSEEVTIIRVLHGARDLATILGDNEE